MGLLRRLSLDLWWRASRLVDVIAVDRLWWLGTCASIKLFFLLLDEGAITRPMTLIYAMNTAVGYFLPSVGIFPPTSIGIVSVTPPSSVVLRLGVTGFVTGDRVHDLWGLRLLGLVWLRLVVIARPLRVHLFDSLAFSFV